ncbi:acyltransferase family protein [Thetidibacter halocola]|uniref:Acyltransferase n=1 Tax=Thetidibacter halocola TaxID=2827239 RepID=A0A8J8B8M5_9RHOB|nr:acyltransferase [Thetidibacter halocola]MBS0124924.1 acyltransferase [Thetidibacter halocola]
MKAHIDDIQILRAVAALAVLFFHAERELSAGGSDALAPLFVGLAWLGQAGVDIFFVISGFIMYFVHRGDFGRPGMMGRFLLRRLVRIVPTYWLLTTLTVAGLVLLPGLFNSRSVDWTWIGASYLFIPWQSPAGDISPPVGPGWTLNFEMYFYVIFGAVLLVPRRVALPVMTVFMVGSVMLGLILKPGLPILAMMSGALLIEFLCGIWIAWAFTRGMTVGGAARIALVAAGLAVLCVSPVFYSNGDLATWWRLPFFGLPAAALVAATILRPGLQGAERAGSPVSRLFVALGDSSYALYLSHIFTLRIIDLVLARLFPQLPLALDFVLLVVAAVVVGHLFFLWVERPLYRFLKQRLPGGRAAEVPA